MAKRKKAKQGRVDAAVTEAEAILRKLIDDTHVRDAVSGRLDAVGAGDEEKVAEKKKKGGFGVGKLIAAAGVIGGGALAASSGLRNKVLDMLFGAEEEFQYTPPAPDAGGAGTEGAAAEGAATEGVAGAATEGADGAGESTPPSAA